MLKQSLRALARSPIVAAAILASVGLGIGATATVFSAVNAALLRPLPYAEPDRLVRIYTDAPPNRFPLSVADYRALGAQQTTFEQIGAYASNASTFSDGVSSERVKGRSVSSDYFALLGIHPALGRLFVSGDGRQGGPRLVVVSHAFWERWCGGRENAIGTALRFDGLDYTLVGVLPKDAGPLEEGQDFFFPAEWPAPPRKGPFFLAVIGRLPKGGDRNAAVNELHGINRRIFPIWRSSYQDDRATWGMVDLKTWIVGDVRVTAGVALACVALVWLIACANASNLLIARVATRRRELAVRAALGASRARNVRHLLLESSLLAGSAATLGIGLAWAGVSLLRDHGAAYFPRMAEVRLDTTTLWLIAALALSSVALFGIVPAVQGSSASIDDALRAEGRTATGSAGVRRLRRALVGAQFAIATPLLVIAALLLVSLARLGRVDLGIDTHDIVTAQLTETTSGHADPAKVTAFWDEMQRRIADVPGVAGVAFTDGRPPADVNNFNNFDLEDAPTPPGHSQPVVPWLAVTPSYFRVAGVSLVEGRLLDDRDSLPSTPPVILVDQAWAARFYPHQSAVGRRLRQGGCTTCPLTTVVGVVTTVKYAGLDKPDEGTVYQPMGPRTTRMVIIRTNGDPASVMASIRDRIRAFDPGVPLYSVATMDELVDRALDRPRSLSALIGGLAVSALVLSIIGIYGVMAYHVQQHTKEIGIRMALGGTARDVLGLVLGQGMSIVAIGVVIGLGGALALARLAATLLFGVSAADPIAIGGVCALLLTTALLACLVPALRAVSIPPAAVLRND
jgi:putative ABC transport system permease protein